MAFFSVNSAKSSPKAEEKPFEEPSNEEKNDENKADQANNASASSYFNSAWTKMGDLTKSVSQNIVGPNKESDSMDLSNKGTDLGSLNETLIVQWESHLGCPGLYNFIFIPIEHLTL